jgi:predicted component of type VI protein secretion system
MQERADELSMPERTTEGYSLQQKRDRLQSRSHVKVLNNGGSAQATTADQQIATIEQYFSSNPAEVAAAWRDAHDGVTVRKLPADDDRPGLAGTYVKCLSVYTMTYAVLHRYMTLLHLLVLYC